MFEVNRETVINFSGGRTSGALLINVLENCNQNQCELIKVVFCNTGLEHEKTYEFVNNVDKYIGKYGLCVDYLE